MRFLIRLQNLYTCERLPVSYYWCSTIVISYCASVVVRSHGCGLSSDRLILKAVSIVLVLEPRTRNVDHSFSSLTIIRVLEIRPS